MTEKQTFVSVSPQADVQVLLVAHSTAGSDRQHYHVLPDLCFIRCHCYHQLPGAGDSVTPPRPASTVGVHQPGAHLPSSQEIPPTVG